MGLQKSEHHSTLGEGFTLVEVLMAMLIMTIGLLGLLQSVNVAYEHNSRNRLREEAVMVGEEQMNEFRTRSYDAISTCMLPSSVPRKVAGGLRDFTVTKQVTENSTHSSKTLRVAISWNYKKASMEHVIHTIRSK